MIIHCVVCKKICNFDLHKGGCYVGKKPHCSAKCAKKTLKMRTK